MGRPACKVCPPVTIRETLMSSARLPVLEKFIADLRTIWSAEADNQRRMERAKPLLDTTQYHRSLKHQRRRRLVPRRLEQRRPQRSDTARWKR